MYATGLTDVGIWRDNNEDNFVLSRLHMDGKQGPQDFLLAMVADGMGGEAAGEIASQTAVETVSREVLAGLPGLRHGADPVAETVELLRSAVLRANESIWVQTREHPDLVGMGTTGTLALLRAGVLYLVHVGDSRGYLWRERELRQMTEDHSWIGEMVKAGVFTPEQARRHPRRNEITRALGIGESVEVDVRPVAVRADDVFLLCSDGLWEMVPDERIQTVLLLPSAPEEAEARLHFWCQTLVNEANSAGGEDNVSVVLLQAEAWDVVEEAEAMLAPRSATKVRRQSGRGASAERLTRTRRYSEGEEAE